MKTNTEEDEFRIFIREHGNEIISICSIAGASVGRFYEALRDLADKLAETGKQIDETLKPLRDNPPEDIPWLKKQIKHCKNPLEEKALRKRLNEATRNRRRNKIGSR